MKISITLSANAGVSIHTGGYRIWVDALHMDKQPGFSAVDLQLQGRMLRANAFANPDVIACTHCHPDHFSLELVRAARALWPQAELLLPEQQLDGQILVHGEMFTHTLGDLSLHFVRLPHEGECYSNCPHYGIIISAGGKQLLLPGDCQTAATELAAAIAGRKIDLALLNFPWLSLKRGREFVQKHLPHAQLAVYHLPFEGDDSCHYRDAALKSTQHQSRTVHLLQEPLQTIELDI